MKNFNINIQNAPVNFSVEEAWLDNLKIKATEDVTAQIFKAAVSDPEASGITTDSNMLNADIEEVKKLVAKAKEINRSTDGAAAIRVALGSDFGVFTVSVDGNIRNEDVTVAEANRALDQIAGFLKHTNLIKVGVAVRGSRKSTQLIAEELTIFINNGMKKGDIRKVLFPINSGDDIMLAYVSKSVFRKLSSCCDCDDDDED